MLEGRKTSLENFFANVKSRVMTHTHHIEHTVLLYKQEHDEAKHKLKVSLKEPYKKLYVDYKALLGQFEDPALDDQHASHVSGLAELENEHARREEQLFDEQMELLGLFHNSAIIQAYSLLEKELKDLCDVLKKETGEAISQHDFASRDYIKGCLKYLSLVIKLDISRLDPFMTKIIDLQYIRNRLIHDRGEFSIEEVDKIKVMNSIIATSSGRIELMDNGDISVINVKDVTYILEYYEIFLNFFQTILVLVEERFGNKIVEAKLKRAFSSLNEVFLIITEQVKPAKSSFTGKFTLHFVNGTTPDLAVELKLTQRKNVRVFSSYKGTANSTLTTLAENLKKHDYLLLNEFFDYLLVHKEISVVLNFVEIVSKTKK